MAYLIVGSAKRKLDPRRGCHITTRAFLGHPLSSANRTTVAENSRAAISTAVGCSDHPMKRSVRLPQPTPRLPIVITAVEQGVEVISPRKAA